MAEDIKEGLLSTFSLAKISSDAGLMREILHMHDVGRMGCIPAIVEEYNYETNEAVVKPIVKFVLNTSGGNEYLDRPSYKVPVYKVCQGGFRVTIPLFTGDTGILFAIDREWEEAKSKNSEELTEDISNISDRIAPPDSLGLASFEYGFFLPLSFSPNSISSNADGIVISTTSGESPYTIRISRDGKISVGSESNFDKKITAADLVVGECSIRKISVISKIEETSDATELTIGECSALCSEVKDGKVIKIPSISGESERLVDGTFSFVTPERVGENELKVKSFVVKNGLIVGVEDAGTVEIASDSGPDIETELVDVLVNTAYSNPTFTQTKRKVLVVKGSEDAGRSETVFTTTPLSDEETND